VRSHRAIMLRNPFVWSVSWGPKTKHLPPKFNLEEALQRFMFRAEYEAATCRPVEPAPRPAPGDGEPAGDAPETIPFPPRPTPPAAPPAAANPAPGLIADLAARMGGAG